MQPTPRHNPLRELFDRLTRDKKDVDLFAELRANSTDPSESPIRLKVKKATIARPEICAAHIACAKTQVRSMLEQAVLNQTYPASGYLNPELADVMQERAKQQADHIWKSGHQISADLSRPDIPIRLRLVKHWIEKIEDLTPLGPPAKPVSSQSR